MTTSAEKSKESDTKKSDALIDVVDDAYENVEGDTTKVGDLMDAISSRGFGPLLLAPSLISISPLGGIPGVSIVTGSLIVLIAVQMLFRSDHPWIPKRLEEFSIPTDRVKKSIEKYRPWLTWGNRWVHQRLKILSVGAMHYVLATLMILLGLSYFPLALVPFGVFLPALANTLLSLGITARDGALIIAGMSVSIASFTVLIWTA
ncbi:exopolysaccharide biosynthesis protein [Thalassoglobus sp. JC818]|uniref:exopolysaccharide biosynthesis protein n=1 Tax=Thalassoglobus sp. JC818 TaxID=3232136 RepID=UPI003458C6D3